LQELSAGARRYVVYFVNKLHFRLLVADKKKAGRGIFNIFFFLFPKNVFKMERELHVPVMRPVEIIPV
jgi:hypothetical protein